MLTEYAHSTGICVGRLPAVAVRAETDIALLGSIATSDTLAMRVFYARHHVRVYRFVLRFVRDGGIAEDIISEVFLDVWRQADRFEGRSAVSTWLLAIARHKAFAALCKRTEEELDEDMAATIEDTRDNPEVALQKQDRNDILRRCLNALPARNREMLDLVYYHEKSVAEVAEIYGIPENTVKTRMFYARKKLAELVRRAGLDRAAL
jgi:RNA polymerase sigma-70 factor (ECF subfamily)